MHACMWGGVWNLARFHLSGASSSRFSLRFDFGPEFGRSKLHFLAFSDFSDRFQTDNVSSFCFPFQTCMLKTALVCGLKQQRSHPRAVDVGEVIGQTVGTQPGSLKCEQHTWNEKKGMTNTNVTYVLPFPLNRYFFSFTLMHVCIPS